MLRIIAGLILLSTIFIYGMQEEKKQGNEVLPFSYVSIDTSSLAYKHRVYVPVNLQQKKSKQREKVLLKVRNTSFTDTIYLSHINYYDSQGALLSNLIDSALLIKPMATGEIMVKSKKFKEDVDNLIVQWYTNGTSKPIVQAIIMDHKSRAVMTEKGVLLPDDLTTLN